MLVIAPEGVARIFARPSFGDRSPRKVCIPYTARSNFMKLLQTTTNHQLPTYRIITASIFSSTLSYILLRSNSRLASPSLHTSFYRTSLFITSCPLRVVSCIGPLLQIVLFSAMRSQRLTPHPQKDLPKPYPPTPTIRQKRLVRASCPCI